MKNSTKSYNSIRQNCITITNKNKNITLVGLYTNFNSF